MKLRLLRNTSDTTSHDSSALELQVRPRKTRRLRDGRLQPIKNHASASNARPKKVVVVHAGGSQALKRLDYDMRSSVGKAYRACVEDLADHLGGPDAVTAPQRILIDHAARLHVLVLLASEELTTGGAFSNGEPRPALDAFRRLSADLREVLRALGLERRVKPLPDLASYLSAKE